VHAVWHTVQLQLDAHTNSGNIAQKWAVTTECNSWGMLFLCIGKTLFGGIIVGELGMMDAQEPKFHIAVYCLCSSQELTCQGIRNYWSWAVVSSTCEALRTSVCLPLSTPDCVATQHELSKHPQRYPDCSLDGLAFPIWPLRLPWAMRAFAPFLPQRYGLPRCWQLHPSTPEG
jgi:hypothetical protein